MSEPFDGRFAWHACVFLCILVVAKLSGHLTIITGLVAAVAYHAGAWWIYPKVVRR